MTITTESTTVVNRSELALVTHSLYRDIHKGIRTDLFAVTEKAGRIDPSSNVDRADLARHVRDVMNFLVDHAEHEDAAILPVLERELPALGDKIASDHEALDRRLHDLVSWADAASVASDSVRHEVFAVHIELAAFTAAFLEHMDVEERVVMPALEATIGVPAIIDIHQAILGSIPPAEMAKSLALMLPAMNIDDRTELLGGVQATAPAEVFEGVWGLAGSVLEPADHAALARRLGVA